MPANSEANYSVINKYYVDPVPVLIGIGMMCSVICAESRAAGLCSLLFLAAFFLYLFNSHAVIFLKYLHFIFSSTATIAGCAVIEYFDVRLNELNDESAFHGALPLLVFSWWLFLMALTLNDTRLSLKLSDDSHWQRLDMKDGFSLKGDNFSMIMFAAACAGFLMIAFTFIMVSDNPSFKLGIDRFDYANQFQYGLLYDQAIRFIRYLIIPCIVVAIYRNNMIGWAALAVYCMHSFWVGSKFGSFFSLLCTFTMIYSHKIKDKLGDLKRLIALLMISIIALVGVAVFAVSFTRDEGTSNYLFPRLSQQGQLWWKTYDTSNAYHINEFGDEILSIKKGSPEISDNVGAKYGIYKIMYYTTPKTMVDSKLQSGSRYTEAGFAAAYYYLGIPGCMLFAIIGGILTSTFVNYFLFYLRYNQYIRAFIHLRLYTNMAVFMSMFVFFTYFNKTSILSYLILLFGSGKIFTYGREQI